MRTEGNGYDGDGGGHGYNTRRTNADVRRRVLSATGDPRERTADGEPIPLFMSNVYNIVDGSNPDIVSWSADGDTFTVHDAVAFARNILPQHFRHSNFSSFVRQLNFYGFRSSSHRDERDPKKRMWEFWHPMFRRGGRELLSRIRRKTYSETAAIAVRGDITNLQQEVEEMRNKMDDLWQTMDLLKRSTLLFVKNSSRKRGRPTAMGMPSSPVIMTDAVAEAGGGTEGGVKREEPVKAEAGTGGGSTVPHPLAVHGIAQSAVARPGSDQPGVEGEQEDRTAKARRQGSPPQLVASSPMTVSAPDGHVARHPGLATTGPAQLAPHAAGSMMPPPAVPVLGEDPESELWGRGEDGEGGFGADLELTPDDLAWLDAQTRWERH